MCRTGRPPGGGTKWMAAGGVTDLVKGGSEAFPGGGSSPGPHPTPSRVPHARTPPLPGWTQAPSPSSVHPGPSQASFEKLQCPFPAAARALLKASLFKAGLKKPQPRPDRLNYLLPPPLSWLFKPPDPPPAQLAGRTPAARVRKEFRVCGEQGSGHLSGKYKMGEGLGSRACMET